MQIFLFTQWTIFCFPDGTVLNHRPQGLIKSNLFSLLACAFDVLTKKSTLNPCLKDFYSTIFSKFYSVTSYT